MVTDCRARDGRCSEHTNMMCIDCKGTHYAMSSICFAKKQAINFACSEEDEWGMTELEREKRREEEEVAAKAKETEGRIQVATMAET